MQSEGYFAYCMLLLLVGTLWGQAKHCNCIMDCIL